MPAARPRASFEPIPPDFDVRTFVETADNFRYADRISYEMIKNNGIEQFEKLVLLHVIIGGKPLVIDGFEEVLDPWTFTPSWLRDNHGEKVENARNLTSKENIPLTVKHYLKHMSKLTEQFFVDPERYRDKTRQRIYLKDIDCPPVWQDKLKEHIPQGVFYLNESTGEIGGPGALDEPGGRKGRGIGRSGDLMSSLPPEMRAENLMCYIGHEGTYTPAHREMCASLGQNIMVNASELVGEGSKPERPGSSIWFMTETKDRHLVSEYWLSILGHDIEVENHFAQLIAWKKAPFKTYVVEQRAGDFILIPPLAPHQVWNRGTRTMKIAWNRTTVETLELALNEALPNSRVVCRDEQYKNKAIVYYTLLKYSNLIKSARAQVEMGGEQAEAIQRSVKIRQVQRDFKRLFDLYKTILLSEMFSPESREHPEFESYDSNVTCSYCRCNIFNRFLTCKSCKNLFSSEIEEPYDVCMDCYCMGRSCSCQSGYTWVEQWKWKDLLHRYEEWRAQIIDIDGQMTEKTPLPLQEERRYLGKKTLAQVCQEQLRLRPYVDVKNPKPEEEEEEEEEDVQVDEYGMARKPAKKKSKQWLTQHKSCHFCLHRHPKWKMAFCSNCDLSYCYGTLFRAHDMMPLTVMENHNWKCPHCRRVCNTGACRRDPRQHPYEPKGTLLGHDTKKVADPRSVECLVDFSVSNLNWLREDESAMQRRRDEAERAKLADPSLDDRYMDDDHDPNRDGIAYSPVNENGFEDSTIAGGDGYVAPSAVMHDPYGGGGADSLYPDPDENGEIPRLGKRNRADDDDEEEGGSRRKKKKKQKKSKDDALVPLQPKSTSGKQYQKEVQRKLLEDAKREDRFILVAARMKGKSKIVKLPMSSDLLEAIEQRPVPERPVPEHQRESSEEPVGELGSILQSDVLPAQKPANDIHRKEKGPKTFRYRVTEDETYSTRKRNLEIGGPVTKPGRPAKGSRRYEEVTIESDSELDDYDMGDFNESGAARRRARESNWLARKNAGEEDLPTELPSDFRDGQVNPNREKNLERQRERRKTMPPKSPKPKPTIRPSGRGPGRPRKSIGNMSGQDGVHEEDDQASALLLAKSAAATLEAREKAEAEKARATAAEREAQENLRAKMGIAEFFEGSGSDNESLNGFIDNLAADDEPLAHERDASMSESPVAQRTGPPQPTNSIFAKPGMVGKKIKIVSARSKRNGESASKTTTTTRIKAPVSTFKGVNAPASKRVELSSDESDSEDQIPAKAPEPAVKTPGRPRGRPSMIPTRGSSSGKRGRGRPRKTM
ncbi:hypothetical protein K458DRAFT_326781 [Lentithecium fluviatile CBS 122367]|uniref:JmjC domain-containing protein n=1 Tax=Lentithecium fluviatile CBS 122367 TaxID=1168545 RepID=A0A6G1JKV3_9PLEO|nr:hypothetical protein K458DRAFT_326781 [Lentithecium fluviatile CBS 122367]